MKIERTLRPSPLTRSIERVVREDDGRAETEAEAVTLDLNEQRKENEGNPFRKNSNGDEPSANTGGSPEQDAEKSPLNVVA
ncbi:MAG: hypothetical protein RL417_2336 [Pseudomonadota bacterium]|jgi:hypothetical protein